MEIIEAERLANSGNMPVIRNPGRVFPGVLIQGDTLAILYDLTYGLHQLNVESLPEDDERRKASRDVVNFIAAFVREYETVLEAHDIRLPYMRETMTASAWQDQP
jgi:hypothetical protein